MAPASTAPNPRQATTPATLVARAFISMAGILARAGSSAGVGGMTSALAGGTRVVMRRQRYDCEQTRRRGAQTQAAAGQLRPRLDQRKAEPRARRVPSGLTAKEPLGRTETVGRGDAGT